MRRLERPLLCVAIIAVGFLIVRELMSSPGPDIPARDAAPESRPVDDRGAPSRPLLG